MLLVLVHLYIVTMDILCQVMHNCMLKASDAHENVNKSNFRNSVNMENCRM